MVWTNEQTDKQIDKQTVSNITSFPRRPTLTAWVINVCRLEERSLYDLKQAVKYVAPRGC